MAGDGRAQRGFPAAPLATHAQPPERIARIGMLRSEHREFYLLMNRKPARAIGLPIPPSLLLRTDQIID